MKRYAGARASRLDDLARLRSTYWLHLAALCSLAITHPLYDLLGRADHAAFFTAHQTQVMDVLLLVLVGSLVLPAALGLVLWAIGLASRRLAGLACLVVLAALFLLVFLPLPVKLFEAPVPLSLGIAGALTLLCTGLYFRFNWARGFVTFLGLAVIVSPAMFFATPSVRSLMSNPAAQAVSWGPRSEQLPDIVLIILDELPLLSLLDENGGVDARLYPNFHRLASTSNWYRNTTTTHISTWGAVASLMVGSDYSSYVAGRRPGAGPASAILDRSKAPHNLFSLLEDEYQVWAIESTSRLALDADASSRFLPPLQQRMLSLLADAAVLYAHAVVPPDLRGRLPAIEGQWRDFTSIGRTTKPRTGPRFPGNAKLFKQLIDQLQVNANPTLYYLHALLPHFPFIYNEAGQQHDNHFQFLSERLRRATGANQWPDETAANLAWQAHLIQTRFTDQLLGRVMERMIELGIFDQAIFIVVSDHGLSFYWDSESVPEAEMTQIQASESLLVPLIVKLPGQRSGQVSDLPAQTIDIVPTLVDALGIEAAWPMGGQSLLGPMFERRQRFARLPRRFALDPELRLHERALRRKFGLFGSSDPERLYHAGPHRELVGKSLHELPRMKQPGTLTIARAERFEDLRLDADRLPAYVEGTMTGLAEPTNGTGMAIAVAVNGVIVNTARTTPFRIGGLRARGQGPAGDWAAVTNPSPGRSEPSPWAYFLARIPPWTLREGDNRVEAFIILTAGPGQTAALGELVGE